MPSHNTPSQAPAFVDRAIERWLRFVVSQRYLVLAVVALSIGTAAYLAGGLKKDTTANAYIEPDNPALLYRERVIDAFGLKEPLVIAVRTPIDAGGVLNADSLRLVRDLVERLESVPNVDVDRITSLVSQSSIAGGEEGIEIERLLPAGEINVATVEKLRAAINDSPLYDGTLVSHDRTATIIVAELLDETRAAETYRAVLDLTQSMARPRGEEVFVAGAGAITGYFSTYIDRDAGRLVPFTAIAVTLILFCAFLTIRSSALPMVIAVATIVSTLGVMAASHVPFYAITNGMIVVLIGISVAEPMHVFGEYYTLQRERPFAENHDVIVDALRNVWRPIALTAVTTVAGFFSLWVTSTMPPIRYFGLFGAFGVLVAWLLTVSFLPAFMAVLPKRPSRLIERSAGAASDPMSRAMMALGARVIRAPRMVLLLSAILCIAALFEAANVKVDHARIENFNESEAIHIADREINRTLAGTNQLDIVIETDHEDGVLAPEVLRRIEALEKHLRSLPEVGGSISIVDYVKQLNRAVDGGAALSWKIPEDPALIAQLLFVYQASVPPTELQSLVDSSRSTALVRTYLRADRWSEQQAIVHAAQKFIDREFADGTAKATLTGRVMLDYEWVQSVASGHAWSVIASTLAVLLMCVAIFRSIRDGLLCLAPLVVSVLFVYAAMGIGDIWLGVATSMFASVAIGLGIDFAIHMISRARKAKARFADVDAQVMYVYQSTGRAVLFNAVAVGIGFSIVTLSAAPPIRMFGVLVSIAIVGAFVAALTVLPALLKLVSERSRRDLPHASALSQRLAPLLVIAVGIWMASGQTANAEDGDADKIMAVVAAREEGESVDRVAHIQLIDRHGVVREQVARAVRKNVADGRRMAIFYQSPANVRGTAFLVFDYQDTAHDSDQWLYLPALRKVRRVPAADRGDYFLGTDLTYDEIRNDSRVTLEDWRFRLIDRSEADGTACAVIEGTASSEAVATQLGYSRANWWIDEKSGMALRIEYWDRAGQLLKTVENRDVRQVNGIWSAMRIEVANHKTGHRTRIDFRDVRFNQKLADTLFTQQQMERGL
ncbi:hypothetical protein HNQ60_001353 [Povalibacter uvarum]|uniref:SSD domain-containing protein n=1 Tax=Povalibacter uvarum TaxID=732238 RepID=A0A841HKC6_9GAMM|nr:outer membrane lipoprotein-sorting protein [Povalibacter uvarum]MBB6092475.1 hypothetical protein [Povalibacter uvarum]